MLIDNLRAATSARLVEINVDDTLKTAALCLSQPGIGLIVVCREGGEAEVFSASRTSSAILLKGSRRAGSAADEAGPLSPARQTTTSTAFGRS
jgi:hypothetical protein